MFYKTSVVRQYGVIIIANFSILCVGLSVVWPSPILLKLKNAIETPLNQTITEREGAWIVSVSYLSSLIGMVLLVFIINRIGRKYCILLGYLPKLFSTVILIFATKYWMLLLARILNGVSDIFILNAIGPYAAEIADTEIRGSLGTINQIMATLGMLIIYAVGPYVSYRTLNIVFFGIILVTLIPTIYIPETPYYLYVTGKKDEALKVLTYFRGSEAIAQLELNEYGQKKDVQIDNKTTFQNQLFTKGLLISIGICTGLNLLGYNVVGVYLQTILELAKTNVEPSTASVVLGLFQLVASVFTSLFTDKFGRKPILSYTTAGIAFGMIGLGVFFKINESGDKLVYGFMNYLPLVSLAIIVICYNAGIGSLYLLLIAEILDSSIRDIGTCISMLCATAVMFLTSRYFEAVISLVGAATTFWMCGLCCIIYCIFIVFCIPETKKKVFSEIQKTLGDPTSTKDKKRDKVMC